MTVQAVGVDGGIIVPTYLLCLRETLFVTGSHHVIIFVHGL